MIGYVKGYNVCNITKKKIENEELFIDLIKIDSEMKDKVLEILDNNGYIIGLKKKKVLKSIYFFSYDKDNKVLKFSNSIQTKDIAKESIEEFEKAILEELKEKVLLEEISKVEWNDNIIEPRQFSNFSGSALAIGISLGVTYGIIFDNIGLGLLFGIAFGLCFGVVVKKK